MCNRLHKNYPVEYILIGARTKARQYGDSFLRFVPRAHDFINKTSTRVTAEIMKKANLYFFGGGHWSLAYCLCSPSWWCGYLQKHLDYILDAQNIYMAFTMAFPNKGVAPIEGSSRL